MAGAQLLLWGAVGLADDLGVSRGFIGLTMVAVGTSLPELVTAIAAARRRETELIIGNLLGSNLFNSLAVGGAISIIGPGMVGDAAVTEVGTAVMLTVSILAVAFMYSGRRVVRSEAVVMLMMYVATIFIVGHGAT